MDTITTTPTRPARRARHPFRRSVIAGAAVPLLIAAEFAMMALIPVAIAVVATWRDPGLRKLRPWATALGGLYALALARWAIGPDRAPSLSKDIDPTLAVAISLAGLAFAARACVLRQAAAHPSPYAARLAPRPAPDPKH
ncbi:hypothetical protein P5P86_11665 [Nocardioides sp. BP30]|uniref:hypothetical protein n=1 Tax=Nocardioides sp. BP30 TaxID=3036374 RepID=UPI0024698B60|nr:hypothetical protein [Nocardioides sp. BP30]WGL50621.1 hypothetical protein P5P86_11665 [Nocardioides sp. BP30]